MRNKLLFTFLAFCTHFALAQNQLFIPPLPEMSFISVVDASKFLGDRWSYMEAGDPQAPVIIAMHGYGGSSVDWRYQLHDLSDTYRVIAWNAPGYMLSDELKTNYPNAKDYADALADFLNALKLNKVYLVGNSFGSRVAASFAYYYPERVIKMAFVGPSAGKKNIPFEERERYTKFRFDQIKDGPYAFANKRVEALLAPNSSPELIELARKGMRGVNPSMFMKGVNFMLSEDHHPELIATKAKMPTLLIAGTEDKVSPIPQNAEPLSKHLPNSRLEVLNGIGHLPHLETPHRVNRLIRDFFGLQPSPKSGLARLNAYEKSVLRQIDSLIQFQEQLTLKQDTVAMKAFYPEDMVITNPFGQMIDKKTMIERVKSGVIKYNKFEKTIEHFSMEGDKVAVVAGKEKVTPTPDASRPDAGKPHERRFTEVWVLREGRWQRLVRHASNL